MDKIDIDKIDKQIKAARVKVIKLNDKLKTVSINIRTCRSSMRKFKKENNQTDTKKTEIELKKLLSQKQTLTKQRERIDTETSKLLKKRDKNTIPIKNKYIKAIIRNKSIEYKNLIQMRKKECKYHLNEITNATKNLNLRRIKRCEPKPKDIQLRTFLNLPTHRTFNSSMKQLYQFIHTILEDIGGQIFSYKSQLQMVDLFYFIAKSVAKGKSYTHILQHFKNKNIAVVTPSAISKKRDKLNPFFLKIFFEKLLAYTTYDINRLTNNKPIDEHIYITDGTTINFCKNLLNTKVTSKDTKNYYKMLVGSIYDLTNDVPVDIKLSADMSEPNLLIEQLDNIPANNILLADGHYFTYDVHTKLMNKNINYIMKISQSLKVCKTFVASKALSQIVDFNGYKIRLIRSNIGKNVRVIGTNLMDNKYSDADILEIYDRRWVIEEYYRVMKCYLNLGEIDEKKIDNLLQDIYVRQIIVVLSKYIEIIGTNYIPLGQDNIKFKVNGKNLVYFVANKFMYLLLYKNVRKKLILRKIFNLICDLVNTVTLIEDDRHNYRIRKTPRTQFDNPGIKDNG